MRCSGCSWKGSIPARSKSPSPIFSCFQACCNWLSYETSHTSSRHTYANATCTTQPGMTLLSDSVASTVSQYITAHTCSQCPSKRLKYTFVAHGWHGGSMSHPKPGRITESIWASITVTSRYEWQWQFVQPRHVARTGARRQSQIYSTKSNTVA